MKIRIKNNGNIITEALDNPAKQAPQQTPFSYYNANIKKQFMQEQMKENVLVNVALGEDLPNPIIFQKAPRDLQNIMYAMQTNKAVKTRGFESWNMDDPIATYNAAEDFCLSIFGNSNRTNIASNKTEVSLNNANKASTSESIIFNLENQLNEVTATGAVATGVQVGMEASNLINSAVGFGAGLASTLGTTIAIHLGIIAAISSGIGTVAGMNTDATPNGATRDEESQELTDPNKLLMNNITTQIQNFSNVQAAIKSYVEKILVSLNNYISVISPGSVQEYRKISKFILQFMHQSTKQANAFVETRLPEIEELEKKQEQKRENRQLRQLAQANEIKDFTALINKMFSTIKNNQVDALKLLEIQQYYESHQKDRSNLFDAAQDGKDALIKYYEKEIEKQSGNTDEKEDNPLGEAVNINNFSNKLNEANKELGEGNKLDLNLKPIYDKLSSKLKQEFDSLFDNFDKNKMEGLDDAKEHMKLLIEEADKTIKDRIEKLTKTSQSGGNEAGLTKTAIQFLAGHPLEADNLLEIWSRHLVDLKQRMSKRLKIMTDVNNTTRTLGWTIAFVKETIPEILARLLTYRYAYQVLSNKGVYSYDTAKARRDSEFYDNNPVIAENYRNSELGILTWILENITQNYTNDGNSLIVPDENGGFKLNNNYLAYATLFCNKLGIPLELQQNGETVKTAVTLSQLNKNENVNASDDALLTIIKNRLQTTNVDYATMRAYIAAENYQEASNSFNKLVNSLSLNNDEKKEKDLIKTTYNKIKEIISSKPISDNNYKDIFYTFNIILNSNSTDIYNTFINNEDNINKLIEKYNEATKNNNIESLNEVKEQVHNIFQYIPFEDVNKDETAWKNIITDIFKEPGQIDYYNYIVSVSGNQYEASIEETCKIAPTLVNLTLSGILSYVDADDKKEHNKEKNNKETEIVNIFQEIKLYCEKIKNASINITKIDALNNSNPVADNVKKEYIKHYKTVINHIFEKYKDLTNKELNITKFAGIIEKIVSYDDKGQYKVIVDILKDIIFEKDNNKKFGKLNLDEQYNILNNLNISIKSIENLVEWQELTKAIKELEKYGENSNAYLQLNNNPNNESIIYFNDKQYNIVNNIYVLNEDNNENINNTESSENEIKKGINVISKDENKAKEILAILKGEKDNSQSTEQINNEEIIKSLDNMIKIITSFSL